MIRDDLRVLRTRLHYLILFSFLFLFSYFLLDYQFVLPSLQSRYFEFVSMLCSVDAVAFSRSITAGS